MRLLPAFSLLLLLTGCIVYDGDGDPPPPPTRFDPIPLPQPVVYRAARDTLQDSGYRLTVASPDDGHLRTAWRPDDADDLSRVTIDLGPTDEGVVPAVRAERQYLGGDPDFPIIERDLDLEPLLYRRLVTAASRPRPSATLRVSPR